MTNEEIKKEAKSRNTWIEREEGFIDGAKWYRDNDPAIEKLKKEIVSLRESIILRNKIIGAFRQPNETIADQF